MEAPCHITQRKQKYQTSRQQEGNKGINLKIGQLVFVKDHQKGTFDPLYAFDHTVPGILNDNMVVLTTPDGKEKKCNIHHIKPMTAVEASTSTLSKFKDSIWNTPEKKLMTSLM